MNILHFTSSARAFTGFGTCQEETSQANPEQIPRNCYSNLLFPFADFFKMSGSLEQLMRKDYSLWDLLEKYSSGNTPREITEKGKKPERQI